MILRRRTFLMSSMAALAAPALVSPAGAQSSWPQRGRPLKMIVPWPAGAANDALGRLIADRLQQKFGVASVTENRVGGAGSSGRRRSSRRILTATRCSPAPSTPRSCPWC